MSAGESRARYRAAGVDVAEGERAVARYQALVSATRPEVMAGIGGFYGAFRLADDTTLVAGADGVGTKVLLAAESGIYDTVGRDVVAMNVNDILTAGAEPLFFLDYLAVGRLDAEVAARVVAGVDAGCREAGCALLGGETAEMPGVYRTGHLDLAGFAVGRILTDRVKPPPVRPGLQIVGLASSGFHANGYSLIRRMLRDHRIDLADPCPGSVRTWGEELLEPTRIYVRPVLAWIRRYGIAAMAHVTGGGLAANLARVLDGYGARLVRQALPIPVAMQALMTIGGLEEDEMRQVWNGGVGYCLVAPEEEAASLVGEARAVGWEAAAIGVVTEDPELLWV
jgi:phosphoribosylformylglycinamidine cyclo-ligase